MARHLAPSPLRKAAVIGLAAFCSGSWASMRSSAQPQVAASDSLNTTGPIQLRNLPIDEATLDALNGAVTARDYVKAEALLGEALKKDPTSIRLLASLGRIFFLDGKYDRSVTVLEEAEGRGPLDEGERFTLAMADVVLGHYGKAGPQLEALVRLYPRTALYHYWLSRIDYSEFHFTPAVLEAKQALQLNAGFTRAHEHLGLCYEALEQNDLAIQSFMNAVRLNQSARNPSPQPPLSLGGLLFKLSRLHEAESYFREALNYDPRSSRAYFQLGIVLEREGKDSEAIQQLQQAVSLDPSYAEAHYVLARVLERNGREGEARSEFASFEKMKRAEQRK